MQLYLSSFGFGFQPSWLRDFAGTRTKVGLILNALDHNHATREKFHTDQSTMLESLGFSVTEIDLRHYFDEPEKLDQALRSLEMLWVNGGNTFILRRALRQSGFDVVGPPLITSEKLMYGGFSAGCAVLHHDLRGIEFSDDPELTPPLYQSAIIWRGLGLIPFSVAVHYQSDHPEADATDREIAYYETHNRPYETLRDGEVLIVNDQGVKKLHNNG
jgi:dipeptidase E